MESSIFFKKHYEIFADYHQFYLMDAEIHPNAPTEYTDKDIQHKIKTEDNIVVIMPERNRSVPAELEILDSAPIDNFEDWQHIAEAGLELSSGKLLIEECCGTSIDKILLPPNTYRVRAYFANLDKLSFDGLDGDDHYKIVIWSAPFEDVKVLKQYQAGRGFD
jgi:hypothetical protein